MTKKLIDSKIDNQVLLLLALKSRLKVCFDALLLLYLRVKKKH